jgi:hypothetical protein
MEVNKIISFLLNIILLNVFLVGQRVHAKDQQKQDISLDENAHEQQLKNNKKSHDGHSIQGVSHENHSQVVVNYRYRCGNASQLLSIKIKLFAIFQDVQDIHTQWITEKRQGAVILNADYNIIHLR